MLYEFEKHSRSVHGIGFNLEAIKRIELGNHYSFWIKIELKNNHDLFNNFDKNIIFNKIVDDEEIYYTYSEIYDKNAKLIIKKFTLSLGEIEESKTIEYAGQLVELLNIRKVNK